MILFVGLLGLLFFFHYEWDKKINQVFQGARDKWMRVTSDDLKDWFFPSMGLGVTSVNFIKNMQAQTSLWRTQIWSLRRFLFSVSQTHLSYFFLLTLLILMFEVNSLFLMALLVPLWFLTKVTQSYIFKKNKIIDIFCQGLEGFLGFVFLLFVMEQVFKNTHLMLPFLQESELVFFLTDTSLLPLLTLFLFGFVAGFLIPIQGYSIYLSFVFYLNSQISYMGFVSFIFGEFFYNFFKMYLHYRAMDQDYFKQTKRLFLYLFLMLGFLYISLGYLRFGLQVGNSYGDFIFQKWLFILTVIYVLFGIYLTFMTWGHFKFKAQELEVKLTDSNFNFNDLELIDQAVVQYIKILLDQRLKKLNEFQLAINEESKKKIPLFVLKKFDNEKEILIKVLAETNK